MDYLAVDDTAAWALSLSNGIVTEIDASTNSAGPSAQVGPTPTCLVAGLGAVWVCDRDGRLRQVNEDTRQVVTFPFGAGMRGLAVDEDTGTLWVDVA